MDQALTTPTGAAERLRRFAMTSAVVGVAALGALAAAGFVQADQFFRSYLFGFLYWLAIGSGSLAILMMYHLTGGAWGAVIRRVLEAATRTLPVLALLFVPLAFGLGHIYSWTDTATVMHDEVLHKKAVYLNVPFFLARAVLYFVIWIGLAAIVSAVAYTGGPFPLGYYGLGDIFVFIFFGLAAVAGTYFVQVGSVSPAAWWMSVPVGLIITAILVVNNLRDIENDRKGNKRTLAVRLGVRCTRIEYLLCLVGAYLIIPLAAWLGLIPWLALLTWLSLPLAIKTARTVFTQAGRPLNAALAGTGQLALLFSLLFWGSLIVAGLIV